MNNIIGNNKKLFICIKPIQNIEKQNKIRNVHGIVEFVVGELKGYIIININ